MSLYSRRNKHVVNRKRLDSKKTLFTVIFLIERLVLSLCDAAFSNICFTSNRLWAENNHLLFDCAVKRAGMVYMGKIRKDCGKHLILWTFWCLSFVANKV